VRCSKPTSTPPDPGAFDTAAQATAGLFAAQAAIALYGARHAEGLGQALKTRDVIGQAKGILMERFGVDPDEAFQMLVHSSQDTNLKLTAVAEWVTTSPLRTGGRGVGAKRGISG